MAELVPITDERHSQTEPHQRSEQADNNPLPQEHADNLGDVRADRFHHADVARLLHRDRNERVHNPERRHDDYEKQQEEHDGALEPDGFEELAVHVDPGLGELRRLKIFLDFLFHLLGAVWIDCPYRDAVEGVTQAVQFLADVDRHEKELGVVQIMAGLKDAGHRQLFWEDDFAQFIDRFLFLIALRFLQLFHSVEDLAEIPRRIDGQFVADGDMKFPRELDAEHSRVPFQIERTL